MPIHFNLSEEACSVRTAGSVNQSIKRAVNSERNIDINLKGTLTATYKLFASAGNLLLKEAGGFCHR